MRSSIAALVVVVLVMPSAHAAAAPEVLDPSSVRIPAGVSALLVEGATGQPLLAVDAGRRRPVASTIKLLTALVAAESLPPGTTVVPGSEVLGVEGASAGLRPGVAQDVDELLAALLLRSGNDVAVALATAVAGDEAAFVALMQERLARLGIDADLASASGLDAGDALTAAELATVARAFLDTPRLAGPASRRTIVLADGTALENRNRLLSVLDGATGLKTGFTSAAGWSLVGSAERDGRTLVAVVLGAADDATRVALAADLLDAGFDLTVPAPSEEVRTIRTGRGAIELRVDVGSLTVPVGTGPRAAWPSPLDPDAPPVEVPMVVGGGGDAATPLTVAPVIVIDHRTGGPGGAGLGVAAASGTYAALRAGLAAGLLG